MNKGLLVAVVLAVLSGALPAGATSVKDACAYGDVRASVAEGFKNGRLRIQDAVLDGAGESSVQPSADNSALFTDDCLFSLSDFPPEFWDWIFDNPSLPPIPTPVFETDDWIVGAASVAVSQPETRADAGELLQTYTPNVEISEKDEVLLKELGEFDPDPFTPTFQESDWNDGEPVVLRATQITFAPNIFLEYDGFGEPTGDYEEAWFKTWYFFVAPGELAPGEYQFKTCVANDGSFDAFAKTFDPSSSYYDVAEYPEVCGLTDIEIVEAT